jgi:hypothetical protein
MEEIQKIYLALPPKKNIDQQFQKRTTETNDA